MRKEHIYSKLICGALLLFGICVPVCAQTGHLSGVRVINDEIKKKGREIHVDFVLDVTDHTADILYWCRSQEAPIPVFSFPLKKSGSSFCGAGRSCS